MAEKNMNAKISVEFEETANRQQLSSGDNLPTLFGKIKKFFTDLKTVCFSGSYNDLSDKPTTATTETDGLMSAADKTKLDSADDTYALKSKYGNTTIDVGRKSNSVIGMRSTAEGGATTASGDYSHAEGSATTASGSSSHAEGSDTVASGSYSHAEGCFTTSNGTDSHAEGSSSRNVVSVIPDLSSDTSNSDIITVWNKSRFSLAKGLASHVENADCLALGHYSHAEGRYNITIGEYSHVEGLYTIANNNHESACGTYNKSNADTLFSIGDGTSDSDRHNAFEITTTGGKLHDKDIATTDIIPDLSAYAKKTDVPNIKVNAAVNADKIEGFPAQKLFCQRDNLASKDLNDCVELGSYFFNGINANAPTSNGTISAGAYAVVDNIIYNKDFIKQTCQFIHGGSAYLGRMFVRYYDKILDSWSEWKEIYTEASKPYISGSFSGTSLLTDSFDHEPSFAICNDNGTIKYGNIYRLSDVFKVSFENLSDTTHKYIIFK